jgi:hypothetical protein
MAKTNERNSLYCKIFNCDRRRGSFCCADCGYKRIGNCKNPCLNGPERCGQAILEKGFGGTSHE